MNRQEIFDIVANHLLMQNKKSEIKIDGTILYKMECTIKARVERGIKLLDEKIPDWFNKIDVETLNMSDSSKCIIGQLLASYDNYYHLGIKDFGGTCWYGFNSYTYMVAYSNEWKELDKEWINQINQRRNSA